MPICFSDRQLVEAQAKFTWVKYHFPLRLVKIVEISPSPWLSKTSSLFSLRESTRKLSVQSSFRTHHTCAANGIWKDGSRHALVACKFPQ